MMLSMLDGPQHATPSMLDGPHADATPSMLDGPHADATPSMLDGLTDRQQDSPPARQASNRSVYMPDRRSADHPVDLAVPPQFLIEQMFEDEPDLMDSIARLVQGHAEVEPDEGFMDIVLSHMINPMSHTNALV